MRPERQKLTFTQQQVTWLFAGCHGAFSGIFVLLKARLIAESRILQRTLMEDTVRLSYFDHHSDQLDELAVRLVYSSICHEIELEEFAETHGVPRGNTLALRRRDLWETFERAHSLGMSRLKRLPDVRGMLSSIGLENLYWGFKLGSQFTHSSRVAFGTRVTAGDPGGEAPEYQISVVGSAYDAASDGLSAVETISSATLAWSRLLDLPARDEVEGQRLPCSRKRRKRVDDWESARGHKDA